MNREKVFNELIETIYEVSRLLRSYESIPRKYGTEDELFMVEVHTLDLIGNYIKITTSEIADITDRTKSAVSQTVDKLIKKELAFKYRNPNNYRQLIIELTPKGQVIYAFHKKLDAAQYEKHLKNLNQFTTEDFLTFIEIAKVMNKGIKRALHGTDILDKHN